MSLPDFLQATRDKIELELDGVTHDIAYPDEANSAQYERVTPTVILSVMGLELIPDSPLWATGRYWPCTVTVDITLRQKLIDSASAGYGRSTYERLWVLASYLAAKFSQAHLLPDVQRGVCEVLRVVQHPDPVQVQRDTFEVSIEFSADIQLDANDTLEVQEGRISIVHDDSQYPLITAANAIFERE